jgi:hypothetical protein
MIDTILNLMFRCPHRRLTRPVSPVGKAGEPHGDAYVVCLDCGKQFAYDLKEMRIGKPLARSHEHGVLHPDLPGERGAKVKYALWASVPLALLAGVVLRGGKKKGGEAERLSPEGVPPARRPKAG